jgi:ABC-type transport system involved in cytochrome bd biosynthesis fused ATPase/permease subunit
MVFIVQWVIVYGYCNDFQAVRYCISAGFFAILWDLHHLEEVMESGANGSEQLQQLKTRLHMFMDTMKEMLMSGQNQSYMEEVSEQNLIISEEMQLL